MKIIVTGGAGFIGSHIVKMLVAGGHAVTVIDNLHTGTLQNLKTVSGQYTFIQADAHKISELDKVDIVYHEGIFSSTPLYRNDRNLIARAITDFVAVLEYCVKYNAKLVFASTSSIYNGHAPPHKEDMIPFVKDYYTETRYFMERLAELYHQMHGLQYVGLRYFSVYGDGEESKRSFANMISQFIWKGLLKKEIEIYGDGSQRRDLINVQDVVTANIIAGTLPHSGIFNVGTGQSYSFNEMIELINTYLDVPIKVKYVPNPLKNYVNIVEADTNKMKTELKFSPKIDINRGIVQTLKYYQSLPNVPDI